MHLSTLVSLLLIGATGVFGGYDKTSKKNIAIYWGQNSLGNINKDTNSWQKPLAEYCTDDVDIVILSFVTSLKGANNKPILNFANQGGQCTQTTDGNLDQCQSLATDIQACQKKGKTILLSIGGQSTPAGGLTFGSEKEAQDNAQAMWDLFGPNDKKTQDRPFFDAAIDGFDLDIETGSAFIPAWATKMKELMGDGKYLSAAPQCPSPSGNGIKDILETGELDMVFVQFYNNPQCAPQTAGDKYTLKDWNDWAAGKSIQFFMGLPAASSAATDTSLNGGYIAPDKVGDIVGTAAQQSAFGGVMLWDASQAWGNDNYHVKVKSALSGSASATPTPS